MFFFAITSLCGAFLLFLVQPLMGKYILPWFGGGPGVWTTCLLFFQLLLLAGYAYAHLLARWMSARRQILLHAALVAAAVALLPIVPAESWKPHTSSNPTMAILLLLLCNLGLPYFVLSATGPLVQHWFSIARPGASPYRLYALSNAGSILALLSYPFVIEPHVTRAVQANLWGWGLGLYAGCLAGCARRLWPLPPTPAVPDVTASDAAVTPLQRTLWLLLPACASTLLLAITNRLCHDVAVVPFLWVLPLALYLLSFIVCFDHARWYARLPFTLALGVVAAAICWAILRDRLWSFPRVISVYASALFVCCMICHGELYRLRPAPRHLTGYYVMIAAGGALGSLFVAWVAPLLFTGYIELPIGLLLCAALLGVVYWRDARHMTHSTSAPLQHSSARKSGPALKQRLHQSRANAAGQRHWYWLSIALPWIVLAGIELVLYTLIRTYPPWKTWLILIQVDLPPLLIAACVVWWRRCKRSQVQAWPTLACAWLTVGWCLLAFTLWLFREQYPQLLEARRNFYGVLRVLDASPADPEWHYRVLYHGRIEHGAQLCSPDRSAWPTTYYYEESGAGLVLRSLSSLPPQHIGVIGLGVGTLATYARTGDAVRIYEIDPDVEYIARTYFTYLSRCAGRLTLVLGDARLSLEQESPQQFDVLLIDAFNGDAIPVHLLTADAFQLYARHLKRDGVLVIHISNRHLNLEAVTANLAREFHYELREISASAAQGKPWTKSSKWVVLTRPEALLKLPMLRRYPALNPVQLARDVPLWTDDYTSLFQILK